MEQHLKRIQDKVQQLLKKQSLLQKEAEKATKENAALKEKLAEQTRHTEELEQKLAAYKMATGSSRNLRVLLFTIDNTFSQSISA